MVLPYRECSQELCIQTAESIESVPLPHFQILFNFCCTHIHRRSISWNDSTELEYRGHDWTELPSKQIKFNPQITASSKEKMFRALSRGLMGFRLSRSDREKLAKSTSEYAWDILVTSMSPSDNQLNLDIDLTVVHKKVWFRYSVVQDSMESAGPTMIPTSQASVESLKSKIIDSLNESCSICLEDFEVLGEVACTPCSHMFHRNCITRWLKTSRNCPFCRFQMPTY